MSNFDNVRNLLASKSKKPAKEHSKSGIGWEISAYTLRGVSVVIPASIIMIQENSWAKSGLGLLATLMLIALVVIFKEPIKKAAGYAPGVVPFTIFVIIAIFFRTATDALLTVGISGLSGSVASVPLHLKYISKQSQQKTPQEEALESIAESLKNLK